jgi:hypothetical protein
MMHGAQVPQTPHDHRSALPKLVPGSVVQHDLAPVSVLLLASTTVPSMKNARSGQYPWQRAKQQQVANPDASCGQYGASDVHEHSLVLLASAPSTHGRQHIPHTTSEHIAFDSEHVHHE